MGKVSGCAMYSECNHGSVSRIIFSVLLIAQGALIIFLLFQNENIRDHMSRIKMAQHSFINAPYASMRFSKGYFDGEEKEGAIDDEEAYSNYLKEREKQKAMKMAVNKEKERVNKGGTVK